MMSDEWRCIHLVEKQKKGPLSANKDNQVIDCHFCPGKNKKKGLYSQISPTTQNYFLEYPAWVLTLWAMRSAVFSFSRSWAGNFSLM